MLPSGGHNSEVVRVRRNGDAVRLRPRDSCHLVGFGVMVMVRVRVRVCEASLEEAWPAQGAVR